MLVKHGVVWGFLDELWLVYSYFIGPCVVFCFFNDITKLSYHKRLVVSSHIKEQILDFFIREILVEALILVWLQPSIDMLININLFSIWCIETRKQFIIMLQMIDEFLSVIRISQIEFRSVLNVNEVLCIVQWTVVNFFIEKQSIPSHFIKEVMQS